MTEQFSIPEVLGIAKFQGRASKVLSNHLSQGIIESRRPTWPWSFLQSRKAALFKTAHPVLDCAGAMAKDLGDFSAAKARTYKQDSMEAVIIA
jgi:hypothetical protein